MIPVTGAVQRELMEERYRVEDAARALIRRIVGEVGLSPELRDEMRYLSAKGDVYFGGIEDLLFFDPSERSADAAELRALRRQTDELFLARANMDRKLRDQRRQAVELEEEAKVNKARRKVTEIEVEIARLDEGAQPT